MAEVFCNALHNNEGAWVFAKASPLHDQSGNIIGAIESIRDITESKRAEEALRESEENFRHSLDDSLLGVRIVTAEGETIYANRAILDFYGFSSLEELRTTPLEKRYTSESYIEFKKRYERRQQGDDSPSEYEVNVVRKNGEVRHLLVSRKGQLWNGKKQYQLLYRDITERKQAEAQLRQSQKMEAIGTLAGGVAHDFNNLLTGILGNIALMRGSLPPADPLLENLNAAETAARQAADLTKGLLTFSRSAMVLPVPMKITAALDAALALLKQSLPATMEIVRDYEQTAWNVLMDQSQLTQILLNLAVNARDAMKGQGTLTIRARNEVVGEEYVQAHPFARTGEFVHLSVTDTGPGMSSEVMQHVFEPFYTTKPIGSGTGLGLSVVYGAVKQACGWITAVSTEGVGATFDIYLPRCLEEPMQSFAPSLLSVDVRGGTVLVVEDEPVVRTVTQALLSRSGYAVLTAADGASALNVLRDHPVGIGLILLDMTMPGMTTSEIVRAIRALDPTVPILLNSGYTSNGAVKEMLEQRSVQGFLGKPYSLGELTDKVQELFHRG
jgi:PAS domain S-box-containing protein